MCFDQMEKENHTNSAKRIQELKSEIEHAKLKQSVDRTCIIDGLKKYLNKVYSEKKTR